MKILIAIACNLLLLAAAGSPTATAADDAWLPLKRSEAVGILTGESGKSRPKVTSLDDMLDALRRYRKSSDGQMDRTLEVLTDLRERLAPYTVWHMSGPDATFSVYMAGEGERLHSLRITLYAVNNSEEQNDSAFRVLSKLFATLYPKASDVTDWPKKSLATAWGSHPLMRETPLPDPDDVFVRRYADGITSSTFGVPPDIAVYDITVRENCVPVVAQGNPFTRHIC